MGLTGQGEVFLRQNPSPARFILSSTRTDILTYLYPIWDCQIQHLLLLADGWGKLSSHGNTCYLGATSLCDVCQESQDPSILCKDTPHLRFSRFSSPVPNIWFFLLMVFWATVTPFALSRTSHSLASSSVLIKNHTMARTGSPTFLQLSSVWRAFYSCWQFERLGNIVRVSSAVRSCNI